MPGRQDIVSVGKYVRLKAQGNSIYFFFNPTFILQKSAAFLHWDSIIYGVICVAGYIFSKKNAEHLTPLSFSHATNRRN
jgi:hypothetical protein